MQRITGFSGTLDKSSTSILDKMDPDKRKRLERDLEIAQGNGFTGGIAQFAMTSGKAPKDVQAAFSATRDKAQGSFTSLSNSTTSTFMSIFKESGDLSAALTAAEGPMEKLVALQQEWGFEADGSFGALKQLFQVLKDNDDVTNSLSGINVELKSMADAGMLTKDRFNDLGDEASKQLDILKERGVSVQDQMLVMQPTLQALYEAQQNFGFATDDATQKLIDMGVANGTVGDQFKDVQSKMLDVLVAIGKALGADIPEAYKKFKDKVQDNSGKAEDAAKDVQDAVGPDLRDQLDTSGRAIADWSRDAQQQFEDVASAASAISLGHSPGGLKEIPITIDRAIPAIQRLHRQIGTLESSYGTTTGAASRLGYDAAGVNGGAGQGGSTTIIISPTITASALDGEDLHNSLVERTMPKVVEILESGVGQFASRVAKVVTTTPRRR